MSDYAKLTVSALYADNADFSPTLAKLNVDDYETTPDELRMDKVDAETGGTTITTSYMATLEQCVVKNHDASNNVTAAFQNAAASAQSQVIKPGQVAVFPDMLASANLTLTASGATCRCTVWITGT